MSLVASPALASSAPATVLVESVSHEDSAISHPRDQDYLSLREGWCNEVELQQATSIYGGYDRKREREEKQRNGRHLAMTKKRS